MTLKRSHMTFGDLSD